MSNLSRAISIFRFADCFLVSIDIEYIELKTWYLL